MYKYLAYTIYEDGTIVSPFGNVINWKDDKYVKLEIDGVVRLRNGLNLLYEVYNGIPVKRTHLVCFKDPNNRIKNKENLIMIPKGWGQSQAHRLEEQEIYNIIEEYAISKDKRKSIKNSNEHPTISMRALAEKYNVSLNTIQRVLNCSDPSKYYKSMKSTNT